jgi:hypothetical protein
LGGGVRDDIVVDIDEDVLRAFVLELIDAHIVDRPRLDCIRAARGDVCVAITFYNLSVGAWPFGRSMSVITRYREGMSADRKKG